MEIQRGAWEARRAYQKQNPLALPQYTEPANAFDLLKAYAAGWLIEPGIAYGKNPPFAPGGSLFNKIVNEAGFGTNSLFAAYQLQKLAARYGFGRGATKPSRGQTRYLFMMVVVGLVKDSLIQLERKSEKTDLVKAVQALAHAGLLEHYGDAAVDVIDDYLVQGGDDTIYLEPEYKKTNALNAFLKSEKLGKTDEFSPNLRTQISLAKKIFRKGEYFVNVKTVLAASV